MGEGVTFTAVRWAGPGGQRLENSVQLPPMFESEPRLFNRGWATCQRLALG